MKKVILLSIDGMRPDGLLKCNAPSLINVIKNSSYTFKAKSVSPTVTLPCHMSMVLGVEPKRHGIISNTYVPQVHNIKGIFEKISDAGGVCAFFTNWNFMRDIALPGSTLYSTYINAYTDESVDTMLVEQAIDLIERKKPDFVFLHQVETDEKGGHDNGWMTEEYYKILRLAFENAVKFIEKFGDEYTIIITADHGGHDRLHGMDIPEDTTIPMFFIGENFEKNKELCGVSLLDIAPTIAKIMGLKPEKEWEGKALF